MRIVDLTKGLKTLLRIRSNEGVMCVRPFRGHSRVTIDFDVYGVLGDQKLLRLRIPSIVCPADMFARVAQHLVEEGYDAAIKENDKGVTGRQVEVLIGPNLGDAVRVAGIALAGIGHHGDVVDVWFENFESYRR